MTTLLPTIATCCIGALLMGCPSGDELVDAPRPASSRELLSDANNNLRTHLVGAEGAIDNENLNGIIKQAFEYIRPCADEPCDSPFWIDPGAEELAQTLADRVLNVANIEDSTPTSVTLRLDSALCPARDGRASDPDCLADVAGEEARLQLSSQRPGDVDVQILIGRSRFEMGSLQLYSTHIATTFEVGHVARFFTKYQVFAEEVPSLLISGRIHARLGLSTYSKYEAQLAVIEPVRFSALNLAPSTELFPIRLNYFNLSLEPTRLTLTAAPHRIATELVTEGLTYEAPLGLFRDLLAPGDEDQQFKHQIRVRVPATRVQFSFSDYEAPSISGLQLDDVLEVTLNHQSIFSLEVDSTEDAGSSFQAHRLQDGLRVEVFPSLHMVATFHLGSLQAQVPSIPEWLVNERLDIRLDGGERSGPTTLIIEEQGQRVRMGNGRLWLDSLGANRQLVLFEDECLTQRDVPLVEDQHPLATLDKVSCR